MLLLLLRTLLHQLVHGLLHGLLHVELRRSGDLAEEIWLAGSPTEGGRSASRGGEGDKGSDEGGEDQW